MQTKNEKRKAKIGKLLAGLTLTLAFALLLWADVTGDLRPIADGASDAGWTLGTVNCSTADCWTEVDDASGASCTTTPSDGDTTYISTTTASQRQTFDIDEASIPNGSTVTSAEVFVCAREEAVDSAIRVTFCVNASCTDSANLTLTGAYADYSAVINFADDTKDGTDDYEIGVFSVNNQAVRVSAIKTVITYTAGGGDQAPLRRTVVFE